MRLIAYILLWSGKTPSHAQSTVGRQLPLLAVFPPRRFFTRRAVRRRDRGGTGGGSGGGSGGGPSEAAGGGPMRGAERGQDLQRQRAPSSRRVWRQHGGPGVFAARPCSSSMFSGAHRGARANLSSGAFGQHQSHTEPSCLWWRFRPAAGSSTTSASTSLARPTLNSTSPRSHGRWRRLAAVMFLARLL